MKCSVCGKAAKRYTIEKKNGEAVVELCESCYQKLYGTQDDLFYPKKGTILKECPSCGTRYAMELTDEDDEAEEDAEEPEE